MVLEKSPKYQHNKQTHNVYKSERDHSSNIEAPHIQHTRIEETLSDSRTQNSDNPSSRTFFFIRGKSLEVLEKFKYYVR